MTGRTTNNCIVILNYNDSERVESLVRSIRDYGSLKHILIVDNQSQDGSFTKLQKLINEKIYVIQAPQNGGYATGNNLGAKWAKENWNVDTLYFANPDVFFEEEAILNIDKILWQTKDYGVATVLVREGYNTWKIPGYWGTVRMLFLVWFTLHKRKMKNAMLEKKGIYEVGVVEGSFFAIKAAVYDEVGGFDEKTFLYLEENILAYRLRQHGYKEVVSSENVYVHEHSKSISKEYKSKSKAFKLFLPSFLIYLQDYLKCNFVQIYIFKFFYILAYIERVLYDVVRKGLSNRGNKK